MMLLQRLRWCARYAWLAYRSPFDITLSEAWREAWISWETNRHERGDEPMPRPAEALYWDAQEWGLDG